MLSKENPAKSIFTVSGGVAYDIVYGNKPYEAEADFLHDLIEKKKYSPGNKLLDAACGTGKHSEYLQKFYDITGFDISSEQINIARERIPKGRFFTSDIRTFKSDEKFDAVICMFSSIAYIYPHSEFEKAVKNLIRHTLDGGVIIIEPWVKKNDWNIDKKGNTRTFHLENGGTLIRSIHRSSNDNLSTLDMKFTLKRPGEKDLTYSEIHKMAFNEKDTYEQTFAKYGFKIEYLKNDLFQRGIYIAVKQP